MKNIEVPGFILPGIEDITCRDFLVGGAAALLLGGCGSGGGGNEASGETRTVEHALGTTEVPVAPQRVVIADRIATLPNLLALGVEPVAAGTATFTEDPFANVPDSYRVDLEDVESLDVDSGVNLERIAALEPDLIIGQDSNVEEVYEELSRIAPTVAITPDYEDFRTELRFAGRVFGMEERAEELIEDFDRRVEEAAGNLGDPGTASVVSMFPGEVRLYSAESVVGGLVESLGARNVPELESLSVGEVGAGVVYGLSEEVIPDLRGETLILLQNLTRQEETDYIAELESRPIWQSLPAVENDRVFTLDVQLSTGFAGLPGLEATLGELIRFFSNDGNDG
jgi:iron complex transport system substrate-binding protein